MDPVIFKINILLPDSVNQHVWKPALKKAGLKQRTLYQTRHTFATLMLDAGELPGWVQHMMAHKTLQMIHEKYYSHIKNYQREDGMAFMENVYQPTTNSDGDPTRVQEWGQVLYHHVVSPCWLKMTRPLRLELSGPSPTSSGLGP